MRREGFKVNWKLVYRVYREEKLSLRVRKRRRIASLVRVPMDVPKRPNLRWSMDFVSDQLGSTGRRFRCLTIVDDFTRECLAIEVDTSLPGDRVARVLDRLAFLRGLPQGIVIDNGPEFTGRALDTWAFARKVKLDHIRPGKPVENAFIERFNGRLRDECLNEHWFSTLKEAQVRIEAWRQDYNRNRPHSSLGDMTPEEFAKTVA